MIFQDNIAKRYLQIHSRKCGILNNLYYYRNGCYCCLVCCRTVGKEYDGAQYEFICTDTAQQIVG